MPEFIRERFGHRKNLLVILHNIGWLFTDKILRMGVGLLIWAWIARYLGPEQFGLWNYVMAISALFGAFAALGLDGVVIRELVKRPESQNELLGTAFTLKLFAGILALIFSLMVILLMWGNDAIRLWLVGLSSAGFILQSVNVIDFYFQSKVQSKYTVYSANAAFLIMLLVKVTLIIQSATLIAFVWASFGEVILTAIFLLLAYKLNHQNMLEWRYDWPLAKSLLKNSWPLILSGLAIMIYMRIDQIMIGQILGNKEVGVFSAAVRISEAWYFIPMAIASSVFPTIILIKQQSETLYIKRLQELFNLISLVGCGVAIFMSFASNHFAILLFGNAYTEASTILAIHVWSGVFVSLGVVSGNWFLIENLQKVILIRTIFGALINILLNLILIPIYSITGAAFSTLLTAIFVNFIVDLGSSRTRSLFNMKLKSFNFLQTFPKE
jgi:PST family polysaccharide transporter